MKKINILYLAFSALCISCSSDSRGKNDYIVFLSDADTDGVNELYSSPITGGTPIKLNQELVTGGNVSEYSISPDFKHVIYRADAQTDELIELYSVPIKGGTPIKLNQTLATGGSLSTSLPITISKDSKYVVYQARAHTAGTRELFSIPITGGIPTKLNQDLILYGGIHNHTISEDSKYVVYQADAEVDGVNEIFSVPIAGGTAIKLNQPLVTDGDTFEDYHISQDSKHVVYRADAEIDDVQELYSVPITGGIQVKLNQTLITGGDVSWRSIIISGNSKYVTYYADAQTNEQYQLYSVPIVGGTPVRLNQDFTADGDVVNHATSEDSKHVVYRANAQISDVFEFYSTSFTGEAPIKLNQAFVAGNIFSFFFSEKMLLSNDSKYVVYHADAEVDGVKEIFSVPIAGGIPIKLNQPLSEHADVLNDSIRISKNSKHVLYIADANNNDVFELYSVPIVGGIPRKLNQDLVFGGNIRHYKISEDSKYVTYLADAETESVFELYRVLIIGGTSTKINQSLVAGGSIESFEL